MMSCCVYQKILQSITSHQWDVYDFVRTVPSGKVTTYKDVSSAVGGSPRSGATVFIHFFEFPHSLFTVVGSALRNNPFAPYIPCHRVIASNFFIGGFFGEWGTNDKTGTRCNQKMYLLMKEGVRFTKDGHLADVEECIWRG
jgi:methylated-DNA-[protein]-cysteine S-methyltransferase